MLRSPSLPWCNRQFPRNRYLLSPTIGVALRAPMSAFHGKLILTVKVNFIRQ